MRPVIIMLVAGCVALSASGCAAVTYVNGSDAAPRESLQSGRRVRVHLEEPRSKVVGNVVRLSADTLVIAPEEGTHNELVVPPSNVRRVELSLGRRSRTGRGAFLGLLGGAVAGSVAFAYLCGESCVGAVGLLALPVGGALAGLGIGAGIGSLIRTERWQPVLWVTF